MYCHADRLACFGYAATLEFEFRSDRSPTKSTYKVSIGLGLVRVVHKRPTTSGRLTLIICWLTQSTTDSVTHTSLTPTPYQSESLIVLPLDGAVVHVYD